MIVIDKACAYCGCPPNPPSMKLKACSGCNMTQFCSVECQKADWPKHKEMCRDLQKALAEGRIGSQYDPADFAGWIGRYSFNVKEACQQAFMLHDRSQRGRCNTECFYLSATYSGDGAAIDSKFSVERVSGLPLTVMPVLFPPSTGFDAAATLADMKTEPVNQQFDHLVLGVLRCDGQIMLEALGYMDEGLDRLVPDPDWNKNFIDRIKRRERYADPTLAPAGAPMMLAPLEEDLR